MHKILTYAVVGVLLGYLFPILVNWTEYILKHILQYVLYILGRIV